MAAPENTLRRLSLALLVTTCIGVLLAGCASSKKQKTAAAPATPLPPQTVAQVKPQPQPPSEPPVAAPVKDDSVIEIDPQEAPPPPPPDMVDVAKAERERRKHAGPPIAVITNKTLKEQATGKLTYSDKPLDEEAQEKRGESAATPESPDPATSSDPAVKEEYWRSKVLDARLRWHDAVERIETLQKKVAGLRQQFYATDDPYQRDKEIKPAWDLALSQLDAARQESTKAREELEDLLQKGRRAGALPGWLREGIEFEPETQEQSNDLPTVEPGEPETVEDQEP